MVIRFASLVLIALLLPQDPDLTQLMKDARSTDSSVRLAAFAKLAEAGEPGKKALLPILRQAEEKAANEFLSVAKSGDAANFRTWLGKEIEAARAAALAVIRDPKVYPEEAHGVAGQPVVDDKVARLRELWNQPASLFAERHPIVNERLYFVKEATDWLKKLGAEPNRFAGKKQAFAELNAIFEVRSIVYDKGERDKIDDVYEANATGESVATDEERRFSRILNDYRVMLGLKPLRLADPLVIAARKHSQEMYDLDYFAHESPVEGNRSPGDRVRKEGYSGNVLENIALCGDAEDAFDGWYHSSGHHRGMIAQNVQLLGAGQSVTKSGSAGRLWTMVAGSGSVPSANKKSKDPREVFLARKEKLKDKDVETRLELVKFCQKNQLDLEANQLLDEVLGIDPENVAAHTALGHVKSEGKWVTAEEKLALDLADKPVAEVIAGAAQRLNDGDVAVRLSAVKLLARVDDVAASAPLARALKDKASEVRMHAAVALGALGANAGTEAVPSLKSVLGDSSFYVANAAAVALWKLGDRSGVPTLFDGLRSGENSRRIDSHKQARSAFGKDFGYAWDLPDAERARVVDEWEAWVKDQG